MAAKVTERVQQQLERTQETLVMSKKSLQAEGKELMGQLADSLAALSKANDKYHKASRDVELGELAIKDMESDPRRKNELARAEKKQVKLQDDAAEAEAAYRQQITETSAFQEEYYKSLMPKILREMQILFSSRVAKLKEVFRLYSEILAMQTLQFTNNHKTVNEGSAGINSEADILEYIQKTESFFVIPSNFEFDPYVKGTAVLKKGWTTTLRRGVLNIAGGDTTPESTIPEAPPPPPIFSRTAVYYVPLQDLMERQKVTHPGLPIPLILKFFCEGIIARGGKEAQGIFRISGSASEVEEIKIDLNLGNFKLPSEPNNIASLFKLWLRALPEPLIPPNLYAPCLELPPPDTIFSQLPELNKKAVGYIVAMLKQFSDPSVVQQTSMGVDNLAAIFGPCLLRCPYEDLTESLVAAENEKKFVANLITDLILPEDNPPITPFNENDYAAATNEGEISAAEPVPVATSESIPPPPPAEATPAPAPASAPAPAPAPAPASASTPAPAPAPAQVPAPAVEQKQRKIPPVPSGKPLPPVRPPPRMPPAAPSKQPAPSAAATVSQASAPANPLSQQGELPAVNSDPALPTCKSVPPGKPTRANSIPPPPPEELQHLRDKIQELDQQCSDLHDARSPVIEDDPPPPPPEETAYSEPAVSEGGSSSEELPLPPATEEGAAAVVQAPDALGLPQPPRRIYALPGGQALTQQVAVESTRSPGPDAATLASSHSTAQQHNSASDMKHVAKRLTSKLFGKSDKDKSDK
eukprot:TRINITY_DN772_c1_g1_i5.p1 TRINITY_DN772_c1_g1~~TRINITY_DN772_c1_g1_i5.p1  ORF type:complete len:862 (-),score=218.77 TRINITY_DN772_c1_g1_i5:1022-3286(-)